MIRSLLATALAGLALVGATSLAVAPDASAASCWSHSCDGKDPQASGCDDARTLDRIDPRGIIVELRQSPKCNAAWTRYDNYWGFPGIASIIDFSGSPSQTKNLAAYQGETGWTKMLSYTYYVRACYRYWVEDYNVWDTTCTRSY